MEHLIRAWASSLRASNKSRKTIETYRESARAFARFHEGLDVAVVRRRHVEAFIAHLLDTQSPSTASVRFRALQQWMKWLMQEEEIKANPMVNMKPPVIPEKPVPVVTDEEIRKLLDTCKGSTFEDRRDNAIIRLFVDTGMRAGELAGLNVEDLDLDLDQAFVMGKGRRPRVLRRHFSVSGMRYSYKTHAPTDSRRRGERRDDRGPKRQTLEAARPRGASEGRPLGRVSRAPHECRRLQFQRQLDAGSDRSAFACGGFHRHDGGEPAGRGRRPTPATAGPGARWGTRDLPCYLVRLLDVGRKKFLL